MSDLSNVEKRRLEKLLGMDTGRVLDFSNRTLSEFVLDCTGLQIYDVRYDNASSSKAHRLRKFWQLEDNRVVGKLMAEMLDYGFSSGKRVRWNCNAARSLHVCCRIASHPWPTLRSRPLRSSKRDPGCSSR